MMLRPVHHVNRIHRKVGSMAAMGTPMAWYCASRIDSPMTLTLAGLAIFTLGLIYGALWTCDKQRSDWGGDTLGNMAAGRVGKWLT